nr:DUF535 family protein [Roseateles oligotrophus]
MKIAKSLYKATRQNGRVFGVRSGTVFALRSLRNFWYFWSNKKIWALSLCLEFFDAGDPGNFLHHLTTKKYLNGEFSVDQRIEYAFNHFLVDDQAFDASYKSAIYGGDGLVLWEKNVEGVNFQMCLRRGSIKIPEGELAVYFFADQDRLHSISFSWICVHGEQGEQEVRPYITRNQARWRQDTEPLEKFERAFPQNSPSYFCYAALQGLALAMDASRVMAIRGVDQCCYDPNDVKHFANAYDAFWTVLGGTDSHALGFEIPVPFLMKPLSEVSSKHRKRAATRRAFWQEIESAARATLASHRRGMPVFSR